jgi:lambda family phage minor tail protein L
MTLAADVQTLEPGAMVELFEVDATAISGDLLRFHAYVQVGSIWWQGNEYKPWPVQAEGFDLQPAKPPTPLLTVGNIDGSISAACLAYQDLVGAVVTRHRTLGKYLDAVNFGGTNTTADPTQEMPLDRWYIERKAAETNTAVQFELSSALDFGGVQLPRRVIIANQCPWTYRSAECGYTGGPVADADDNATSSSDQDVCGKRLTSCKLRFGQNNPLPYGGFPAAALTR